MSSEALLTEALKMIADDGAEDGDEDETDVEDGGRETGDEDDDGAVKKRSKSHKHKKSKKKKHKKEKKRKREKEREEYDSEDDRQKSEHHRKKKRKDRDREEEEEEGEIRKVKVEIKQDYDDVWHPGDDRRDFESKRVIRRYPTPPRGFDEAERDRHRSSHREESRSHRDRDFREDSRSHRDEPRSRRDDSRSHREESRSHRDDSRSHREESRSHRDESRSHKKSSRRSPSPSHSSRDRDNKKRSRRSRSRSRDRRSQQPRPPVRKEDSGGDSFWDTKYEANELQKKVDKQEKKGLHYLDLDEVDARRAFRTPTPEREKRRKGDKRSPSPECDELRRLRELKEMQELTVKEDEKFVKEPLDPKLFEWDTKTKMWRRKEKPDEGATKFTAAITYEDELRKAMEKQFQEGKRSQPPSKSRSRSASPEGPKRLAIEGPKERNIEDMPNSQLTMDEIEKIKRKKKANEILKKEEEDKKKRREKRKKDKDKDKSEEKEEGEYNSEEEERSSSRRKRSRRSRSRSRSRERRPRGVPSGSANMAPIGGRGGGGGGRGRSRSRSRERGRGGFGYRMSRSRSRSPERGRRGGFGWRSRSRSWSPARRGGFGFRRSRSRSRSRDRYRGRGRSRSRSRSRDGGWRRRGRRYMSRSRSRDRGFRGSRTAVDKEKLLAIAKKNAVKLLSSDNLMGMDEDRLRAIKSGGQSLSQLTQFCRELAKKGITDEFSDDDGIMDAKSDDEVHHPFEVSDKALPNPYFPGSSFGPSGLALETKMNPTMKAAAKSHRMIEFPVSSGNAHRVKEAEFIAEIEHEAKLALEGPSEAEMNKKAEEEAKAIEKQILEAREKSAAEKAAAQVAAAKVKEPKKEGEGEGEGDKKSQTLAEIANQQNPLGVLMFGGAKEPEEVEKQLVDAGIFDKKEEAVAAAAEGDGATKPEADKKPEDAPVPSTSTAAPTPAPVVPAATPAAAPAAPLALPAPPKSDKVFEKEDPVGDISAIVSQRLAAMRKLEENPNDPEALAAMYKAQKQMSTWAESKNKPGQFTGHTGAKVLSKHELNLGVQAWARQEQFTTAKKVSGGFGEYLLRKMGWSDGDGLGKNRHGEVDPLTLEIKFDKKGLHSAEEGIMKRRKGDALTLTGCKDISGKHPVSALIEVSTKRRWGQPNFVQAFEVGPSHKKQYIFKVVVDGKTYQPSVACDNKKKAKADAATFALQQLGFMAVDPNNPL